MNREPADWVVAYVETDITLGHGETQCHLFVGAMLALGWKVVLVAHDAEAADRWLAAERPHQAHRVHVVGIPRHERGYDPVERWRMAESLLRRAEQESGWRVDLALLTWFDGLRPHWASVGSCLGSLTCPWAALYFSPSHLRAGTRGSWLRKLKGWLVDVLLFRQSHCCGVGILDEGIQPRLEWIVGRRPVVVFPEATDDHTGDTSAVEAIRSAAQGRPIVGLLGHLAPRKGVLNFLRAAARLEEGRAFFLMAGMMDRGSFRRRDLDELDRLLRLPERGNAYFRPELIRSAQEFNALFELCDIHCLVYRGHYHSSGLLAKAAVAGKPVITASGFCMGERVERYGMGLTVPPDDPGRLASAIECLADPGTRERLVETGGFAAYRALNTPQRLEESLRTLCGPAQG